MTVRERGRSFDCVFLCLFSHDFFFFFFFTTYDYVYRLDEGLLFMC